MSRYARFIPLMVWIGVTSYLTPAWESSTPVGHAGLMCCAAFVMLMYWWTGKLSFNWNALIFVVGMLPDMAVTLISYHATGDWTFEANAWVGSTGNVLLIVPFTLGMAGSIWLLKDEVAGHVLMRWCALMRCVAVFSHFVLWFALVT